MLLNVILASVLVSLISLFCAFALFKKGALQSNYGGFLLSMAAGVMLATAVIDLLPEAIEDSGGGKGVYWAIMAGVAGFFVLERFLIFFHHHDHHEHGHTHKSVAEKADSKIKPSVYLILFGDSFHNFFDGVALAAAFAISPGVGWAITIAVILHEIPHELANFVALVHNGLSVRKALLYNLVSAIPALLGALGGYYFLQYFEGTLSYLVGFNAGMFIYIACSDMIPALHEDFKQDRKWTQTITFLAGLLLMGGLISYLNV